MDVTKLFDAVRKIKDKALNQADVDLINAVLNGDTTPVVIPGRMMQLHNEAAFFDKIRPLLAPMTQSEVDGCKAILAACGTAGFGIGDTAYTLGTAYHETAGTMQPVKEYGGTAYFTRMYDITGARPAKARELGNLSPGDGAKYCGRGYPQLTGKKNYQKATDKLRKLGVLTAQESLVDTPDLAMRPDVAAAIMVYGMSEGWFTGRDLDDDIPRSGPATYDQFVRSRDIVNGTDKAAKIAQEAVVFQEGLLVGEWG